MAPIFTGGKFGFGRSAEQVIPPIPVNIYLWGAQGGPGRGGDPDSGGWVKVSGTVAPGTTIGYIVGQYGVPRNFYTGGGGAAYSSGGGFSAAFIGPATPENGDSYILGLAGGAGGGGNDGYGDARGGAGGGPAGNIAYESPNFGQSGGGGTQSSGGAINGQKWLGGGPAGFGGGGGGGYYGGGSGRSNPSYAAGGGGGSGYVNSGTITQPGFGSFTITSTTNNIGTSSGHNNTSPYPNPVITGGVPGKVVIEVGGVAVVNTTASPPGTAVNTYFVP